MRNSLLHYLLALGIFLIQILPRRSFKLSFGKHYHYSLRRNAANMIDKGLETVDVQNVSIRYEAVIEKEDDIDISYSSELQRSEFNPKPLSSGDPVDVWNWWQRRKMSEILLKSAIRSNESDIRF